MLAFYNQKSLINFIQEQRQINIYINYEGQEPIFKQIVKSRIITEQRIGMKDHFEKLSTHLIFYNKKQHYKNILEAKKSINFQRFERQIKANSCVRSNHKYQMQKDRQRKQTNQRLTSRISEIKKRVNQREQFSKRYDSQKKKREGLLYGSFYIFNQKIYQENIKLIQRLTEVKPAIGTKNQWDKHYQKVKKTEKNMTKYRKDKYINYQTELKEAIFCLTKRNKQTQRSRKLLTTLGRYNTCASQQIEQQNNKKFRRRKSLKQRQDLTSIITKSKTIQKISSKTELQPQQKRKKVLNYDGKYKSQTSQFNKIYYQQRYNINQKSKRLNSYTYYKQSRLGEGRNDQKYKLTNKSRIDAILDQKDESQSQKNKKQDIKKQILDINQSQQFSHVQGDQMQSKSNYKQSIYSILRDKSTRLEECLTLST